MSGNTATQAFVFVEPRSIEEARGRITAISNAIAELRASHHRKLTAFAAGVSPEKRSRWFRQFNADNEQMRAEVSALNKWYNAARREAAVALGGPAAVPAGSEPVTVTKDTIWTVYVRAAAAIYSMANGGAPVTPEAEKFIHDVDASVPAAFLREQSALRQQRHEELAAWCQARGAPVILGANLLVSVGDRLYAVDIAEVDAGRRDYDVEIHPVDSDERIKPSSPDYRCVHDIAWRMLWRIAAANLHERIVHAKANNYNLR